MPHKDHADIVNGGASACSPTASSAALSSSQTTTLFSTCVSAQHRHSVISDVSGGYRPDWHWEWIGNSLHPYYEGNDPAAMIDDDALIQATLQHWHWGEDGSGDIRRPHNVAAICASAGAMALDLGTGGALLVTADGSIDCQENPNEQVLPLNAG